MAKEEPQGAEKDSRTVGSNLLRTGSSRILGVALIVSSAFLFVVAFFTSFLPFEFASLVSFVLGVALLAVELEPRVRLSVANDSMLGELRALVSALKIMQVAGKATYIPQGKEVKMVMAQPPSIFPIELLPVGSGLHDEIVGQLGDISGKGLDFFNLWIPKVLVDNLSLADNVKVSRQGDGVTISMERPFVRRLCIDPFVNANVCGTMGCPLAGAVAQALAVTTGKEVHFENCSFEARSQKAETSLTLGKSV